MQDICILDDIHYTMRDHRIKEKIFYFGRFIVYGSLKLLFQREASVVVEDDHCIINANTTLATMQSL